MKIDKISITYNRAFNLGDYNSLRLEATVWADVDEGDNPDECIRALQEQVRDAVKKEYGRLKDTVPPNGRVEAKAQVAGKDVA